MLQRIPLANTANIGNPMLDPSIAAIFIESIGYNRPHAATHYTYSLDLPCCPKRN